MTIAIFCILIASLLPIFCAGLAKRGGFGKHPREGGYDNRSPREWVAKQSDDRARWANAAQANSFEALPLFVASVLVVHLLGANGVLCDALAVSFVVLRVAYIALYISGKHAMRSMVWTLGFFICIAIFLLPVFK